MYTVIPVGGVPGGECYLLTTEDRAILIDSGFPCSADRALVNIRRALEGRPLTHILLTHSHYDHAGGSARIRQEYPEAKVVAGAHAAKILAKDSARALMRELSESAAADQGIAGTGYNDAIDELSVDIPVTDGDIVEAGGLRFRVIETPGHTKCSVSYYCEEEGLLIASETTGIAITPPDVLPCYIIGYQMTMDSIAKCAALAPQDMLVPHWGLLPAGTTGTFLANAAVEAEKLYNFILEGHDAGLDADGIVAKYRERYYTPEVARCQPEKAFLLNANALVPRMLKEAGRVE
ncbi:MAG: MBL fold metallo-hydrolase [Ruminococcaceae bacterium]|nr:MBL fold metallo-hydrolase [Oscillospiraceae bacterium]